VFSEKKNNGINKFLGHVSPATNEAVDLPENKGS
jgi:hypothetical protein